MLHTFFLLLLLSFFSSSHSRHSCIGFNLEIYPSVEEYVSTVDILTFHFFTIDSNEIKDTSGIHALNSFVRTFNGYTFHSQSKREKVDSELSVSKDKKKKKNVNEKRERTKERKELR